MSKPKRNPATHRSGPRKGLPKFCECGGKLDYAFSFGRVWPACLKCTPVTTVRLPIGKR